LARMRPMARAVPAKVEPMARAALAKAAPTERAAPAMVGSAMVLAAGSAAVASWQGRGVWC
jgi:hypothetical protein